jgi:hypothetical protein
VAFTVSRDVAIPVLLLSTAGGAHLRSTYVGLSLVLVQLNSYGSLFAVVYI